MLSDGEQAYRQAVRYVMSMKGMEATAEQMSGVIGPLVAPLDSKHSARLVYIALTRVRLWPAMAQQYLSAWTAASMAATSSPLEVTVEHQEMSPDEVSKLSEHVARYGLAGLSSKQVLLLVLVCLFTVGLPFVQDMVPQNIQSKVTSEEVALGIGVPVALALIEKRQK